MPGIFWGGSWASCCCGSGPPPGCVITICVTGCGQAVPDALVTIGTKTCTTVLSMDTFSACCDIDVGAPGTYTITVSATGFTTNTNTYTVACLDTVDIDLTPTAETGCGCAGNCPAVPATLTGSDGLGSFTLTYVGGSQWKGCAMRTISGVSSDNSACVSPLGPSTFSTPVFFTFECDEFSDGGYNLIGQIATCSDGTPIRGIDCTFVSTFFTTVFSDATNNLPSTCTPFDWTGNAPGGGCDVPGGTCITPVGGCGIYGCPGGGISLTVTA